MMLDMQKKYGRNLGGSNAQKSLCFGIYHSYDGVSTKDLRRPTDALWSAFWYDITNYKAMEYAINTLHDYRRVKGEEVKPDPHMIHSYSPMCESTGRMDEEA